VSDQDDPDIPCEDQLEASQREIQKLREENRELLKASNAFGQLAERLNSELRNERRLGETDRRRQSRPGSMSRRSPPEAMALPMEP
jgi:hypothetical protein